MDLKTVIKSKIRQKEKSKCSILTHICEIEKMVQMNLLSGQE